MIEKYIYKKKKKNDNPNKSLKSFKFKPLEPIGQLKFQISSINFAIGNCFPQSLNPSLFMEMLVFDTTTSFCPKVPYFYAHLL